MRTVYLDIIQDRRQQQQQHKTDTTLSDISEEQEEHDMISNLMSCMYKDGTPVPDSEVANMMITLLMGGQHSSSSAGAWVMLELAAHPEVVEELYQEQVLNLPEPTTNDDNEKRPLPPLRYADLDKLPLLHSVVKETLRLHGSIHSIMRKVKNPLPVPGTPYVLGTNKVVLASPMMTALSDEFFSDAKTWNPHRWLDRAGKEKDEQQPADEKDTIDYGYGAVPRSSTRSPYIPFGAGRHRCIGEKFAYLNLGVIVATLVREFELGTVDGSRGVVPRTDHSSMFARPPAGSMIEWKRRQ